MGLYMFVKGNTTRSMFEISYEFNGRNLDCLPNGRLLPTLALLKVLEGILRPDCPLRI